jgi:uncharacterized surface protein with fasciclin (FAS1) repeats
MTRKAVVAMNQNNRKYRVSGLGQFGLAALACVAGLMFSGCGHSSESSTASAKGGAPASAMDIVETAQGAGSFKTLVAAVTAADLVDALKGAGPFTVFAPTDAAFAKLPAGTVENLLKPENKAQLQAVLKYHVVASKVPAADVVNLTSADTLEGSPVKISVRDGVVNINQSKVIQADVMASNGVIHVIDAVLLPSAK